MARYQRKCGGWRNDSPLRYEGPPNPHLQVDDLGTPVLQALRQYAVQPLFKREQDDRAEVKERDGVTERIHTGRGRYFGQVRVRVGHVGKNPSAGEQ